MKWFTPISGYLNAENDSRIHAISHGIPPFWINPRWSGPVSTIHHAAGHVFAVTRITFHHHRGWFENGHGDLCHRQLFMIGLLRRNDRRIRGQHEMNARVRDQIGLESWMRRSHKGAQKNISTVKYIYIYLAIIEGTKIWDVCISELLKGKNKIIHMICASQKLGDVDIQCTIETWSFDVCVRKAEFLNSSVPRKTLL